MTVNDRTSLKFFFSTQKVWEGNIGFEGRKVQYEDIRIDQYVQTAQPGPDYMTTPKSWMDALEGASLVERGLYAHEGPLFASPLWHRT